MIFRHARTFDESIKFMRQLLFTYPRVLSFLIIAVVVNTVVAFAPVGYIRIAIVACYVFLFIR
jgi:hypothetical protein